MHGTTNREVKRLAILIGSPGSGNNRLPGVPNDLVNWKQYLCSPRGGAWNPDEIITLFDPATDDVVDLIDHVKADYLFVYYSGHGYMDQLQRNILSIRGQGAQDLRFFSGLCDRQLIIVDACRKFLPTISGFPEEIEQWQYASGYSEAREVFTQYIKDSPPGRMVIHSTSYNAYAYDNRDGHGGEFSLALLESLYMSEANIGYQPVWAEDAFSRACEILKAAGEDQVPQITWMDGSLQIPLGIASPHFLRREIVENNRREMLEQFRPKKAALTEGETVILGIAALFIGGALLGGK